MVFIPTDRWEEMINTQGVIEFLHNNLVNGFQEDDIVLESVMLIGTICRNDATAQQIACNIPLN